MSARVLVLAALALAACSGQTTSDCKDGGKCGTATATGGGGAGGKTGGGGIGNSPSGGGAPGGGGIGGVTGDGGSGGTVENFMRVGRACAVDAECGAGLQCVTANASVFDGEGPPKGFCTTNCVATPTICAQFAPETMCMSFKNGEAYCFEGCTFGPDNLQVFDPKKCYGRSESACTPFFDANGNFSNAACFPQCNSDLDCGSGLHCNPRTGLCSTVQATGKDLGAACTMPGDGGTESCKGKCLDLWHADGTVYASVCSQDCTLGASSSCGWGGPGTGPAPATCLFSSLAVIDNGGPGIGDEGQCGALCDCDADCATGTICVPWLGASAVQLEDYFGRKGYCGDSQAPDGGVVSGLACVGNDP